MNRIPSILISVVLAALSAAWPASTSAQTIYVATNGNDTTGTGSSSKPYASLAKAQEAIRTATCGSRSTPATVNIGQGTYYLALSPTNPGTLTFSCLDSGTASNPVVWQGNPSNTSAAIVNGGVLIGGTVGKSGLGLTWTQTTGHGLTVSNVWQVTLPSSVGTFTLQPFNYLYYIPSGATTGPQRRLRARVESSTSTSVGYYMSAANDCVSTQTGSTVSTSDCNWGTFLRVANTVTPGSGVGGTGTNGTCPSETNSNDTSESKCLDRFYYNTSDPISATWTNLNGTYSSSLLSSQSPPCTFSTGSGTYPEGDISLMLFDAWTVDAMSIACVDTTDGVIFLQGATESNSGVYNFHGPAVGHRYIVENVLNDFFTAANNGQTQLWFVDRSGTSPILYYIAGSSEVPNSDTVIIPQLPYSAQLSNQFPQGVNNTDFVGGSLIWAQDSIGTAGLSNVTFSNIGFEIDDFVPTLAGFNNDVNGELSVPQAIDCEGCQNVTFTGITIAHTSGSGILVASPPANNNTTSAATGDTVELSTFEDLGDSGIRVGHTVSTSDTTSGVVNDLNINNNLVDGYSRIFADGEGIAGGNGQGITISHNDITDGYHAGISICKDSCGPFVSNVGVSGSNITSEWNHLWNMMQGITSDGGSLYYNIGGPSGSGTNNSITNNLVHDTTDSVIIDGFQVYPGTGYGGNGIYLDSDSAAVSVENNVVYHVSGYAASMTAGPTTSFTQVIGTSANSPNLFQNNIFSLAIQGMFAEQTPWPGACPSSAFTTTQLFWNIWNTDLNENLTTWQGAFAQGGCTNSCGQTYSAFQNFQYNAYWRANTSTTGYPTFCNDTNAFHVVASPNNTTGSCPASTNTSLYDWLTFDGVPTGQSWQQGAPPYTPVTMDEDAGGTCLFNPEFGTTGNPSDYTLSSSPNAKFQITYTNDTISEAGRQTESAIPNIPATFPTYKFPTSTQGW
jgi:hypothetical protein